MNTNEAAEQLKNVCRFKHLSIQPERAYLHWYWRYAAFAKTRQDADRETKVRGFLTHLSLLFVSAQSATDRSGMAVHTTRLSHDHKHHNHK